MPRLLGLVQCPLDLAMSQAIGLLQSCRDLLLHGERQIQGHRRHRLDQQLADGGIDLCAEDALAHRVTEALAAAEAALAHQACRQGLSALYLRAPRLFDELSLGHADGSFRKPLAAIAKIAVVVIDDFAIAPIGPRERTDLLELLDDRVGSRSTIITSQLPVVHWHEYIGDPTLADAILDRLVHSAHQIHLAGKESMRKRTASAKVTMKNKLTDDDCSV